jgi:hypothetical protein
MNGGPIRDVFIYTNLNPESHITWAAFYSLTIPIHAIFRPSAGFHPDPWAACVAPRRGGAPSVDGENFWNSKQSGFCEHITAVFSDVIHQVRGSEVADRKNSSLMCTP